MQASHGVLHHMIVAAHPQLLATPTLLTKHGLCCRYHRLPGACASAAVLPSHRWAL
jgi:hypothetical protein